MPFSVVADSTTSTVRLIGELDSHTACLLRRALQAQVDQQDVDLCIDAGDLTFIDAAGFDVLREARQCLHERGGRLAVVRYDPLFAQVARICDLHDILAGS